MADSNVKLPDIELFSGRYWFTAYTSERGGVIKGPFDTKHEAEKAQKAYALQETKCQETQKSLTSSPVSSPSASA